MRAFLCHELIVPLMTSHRFRFLCLLRLQVRPLYAASCPVAVRVQRQEKLLLRYAFFLARLFCRGRRCVGLSWFSSGVFAVKQTGS